MRKKIFFILFVFLLIAADIFSAIIKQRVYFSGNNICNYFQNTGIFNQNTASVNAPGFFWPCGSTNQYCFTAGINAVCKIDNRLAEFSCSYYGELSPGFFKSQNEIIKKDFKMYSVKRGDNNSNPDYANWYKMVPYGAPYFDVNNNCRFDIGIDIPGVKDAEQTIFVCLNDGDLSLRNPGEGFCGGINDPILYAEVRMTVWGYKEPSVLIPDAQFIKYEIINKGSKIWDSTFFSIYADPDIGTPTRNFTGCDSARNLGFGYCADSTLYGAYGIKVLKGPINKETGDTIFMSSFTSSILGDNCGFIDCPYTSKGLKKNNVWYLNPAYSPPRKTKYVFSGDPESNTGWTPSTGFINNCTNSDTGTILPVYPHDVKFLLSFGADNLKIYPGDTQKIYLAQMVAKGFSNQNSVTRLKKLSDCISVFFKNDVIQNLEACNYLPEIPWEFSLEQNFPNPFNAVTKIQFNIPRSSYVKLAIYDILGREVAILANGNHEPGFYEIPFNAYNYASGIYFYRIEAIDKTINMQKIYSSVKKLAVLK
jgi:hypothetical protein